MGLSRDFHEEGNVGTLGRLVLTNPAVGELAYLIVFGLIPPIMDLCASMSVLYFRFGAYVVIMNALISVLYLWASVECIQRQNQSRAEFHSADKHQHTVFYQSIANWSMAISFGQIGKEMFRYMQAVHKMSEVGRQYSNWNYTRLSVGLTILYAGCAWIVLQAPQGMSSAGDFILLVTSWNRLFIPLQELVNSGSKIMGHVSKTREFVDLLKRRPLVQDHPDAVSLPSEFLGDVRFDDVGFAYPLKTAYSLRGISVSFRMGQTTAIVGESGGGKSTIFKLMLREYDPSEGLIQIDGRDIRYLTSTSLRQYIGIIPQGIYFPDESILSILQYANPNASLDDIEKVCEMVGLLEWIRTLPAGFETTVGDRGAKLSGGQSQRLSIAQNILKKPKILLLDEATSGVDAVTKRLIQRFLNESTHTKIMITHDLDSVRDVDKIIVIKDGIVVDQG